MEPVYPNHFESLPLEQFLTHLYFHNGVATVRDCGGLAKIAPSRQLYRAVESRRSELRSAGYRTLSYMDTGMIQIYHPIRRSDYRREKYGDLVHTVLLWAIIATVLAAAWGYL